MSLPQYAPASWANTKVNMYTLSSHGRFFLDYMHEGGTALTPSQFGVVHEDMIFLPCRNCGLCTWSPCAISSKPFKSIKPGSYIDCSFALMIGLIHDSDNILAFRYLRWRYDLGPHKTLADVR